MDKDTQNIITEFEINRVLDNKNLKNNKSKSSSSISNFLINKSNGLIKNEKQVKLLSILLFVITTLLLIMVIR